VRRREFIIGLGAAALPRGTRAQQSDRVRRVAVLVDIAEDDPETQSRLAALRRGLAARGWIEGGNLRLEYIFAHGNADRVRSAAVSWAKATVTRFDPEVPVAVW
jgi:putative tryptophan/tyrosine transport system substrate-binding protein